MKLIHYIKTKGNVTVARQEYIMREYPCFERVENDVETAIKALRMKRALVVAHVGLLAPVGPELIDIAARIHLKGGYIIEAATGRESHYGPDALAMGVNAIKRKTMTREKAKTIAQKYTDDQFEKLLPRWNAGDNRELMAKDIGCSLATLQRRMHGLGAKKRAPGRRRK